MTRKAFLASVAVLGLAIGGSLGWAATSEKERAELAESMKNAKTPLEDGLKASEKDGKPISAKFEVEHGKLQLSVYTLKGNDFNEVVVNPQTGAVEKAEKITDKEDLEAAETQKGVMAKATVSLLVATEKAVKSNSGYRAVSIFPSIKDGHPAADVTLLRGAEFKEVAEKLD